MSYEIEYTLHAQNELLETYLWIQERAPFSSIRWREEMIAKVESLAVDPLRHRLAPESSRFSVQVRQMLFRKRHSQFRILFTVSARRVVILSIRHHSRKPLEEGDLPL